MGICSYSVYVDDVSGFVIVQYIVSGDENIHQISI